MYKGNWIIQVGRMFIDEHGKLIPNKQGAHKWHYKKDAMIESAQYGIGSDGSCYPVRVVDYAKV